MRAAERLVVPQHLVEEVVVAVGRRQHRVLEEREDDAVRGREVLAEQVAAGERGLTGVMLESFLVEGKQEPGPPATLTYGQSVTDACMDFGTTAAVLAELAGAVRTRRRAAG